MVYQNALVPDSEWRELIDFYFQAKALVALAEVAESGQRLCIPAIVELRSALDHVMRVMHVTILSGQTEKILGAVNDDPRPKIPADDTGKSKYCQANLSKVKGHLFRATYDALDVLVMCALDEYQQLTRHFGFDDICEVLPGFPDKAARIEQVRQKVVCCKMYKDVELDGQATEEVNRTVIEEYLISYSAIREICRDLREHCLRIRAAARRRRNETRKTLAYGTLGSLIAAIIVAVGIWLSRLLPVGNNDAVVPGQQPPGVSTQHPVNPTSPQSKQ